MITLTLRDKTLLVDDIYHFTFEKPRNFAWEAGQHFVMTVNHENADTRGISRALSIVTSPLEETIRCISHCPEQGGSTFKAALSKLKPGDTVEVTHPAGQFVYRESVIAPVFVAGGVGIGAVRAILVDRHLRGKVLAGKLLYYTATEHSFLFQQEFAKLTELHPQFSVEYLVSTGLKETGGIKEVEQVSAHDLYFSAVYTQERLEASKIGEAVKRLQSQEAAQQEEAMLLANAAHMGW